MLDLFAGSGSLSFEALSRGAAYAVLVDHDRRALADIKRSAAVLGLDGSAKTVRADLSSPSGAVRRLADEAGFDLLYADAPYDLVGLVPPILDELQRAMLLEPGAFVVVEHPNTHSWRWTKGLAPEADYRYGQTVISLGVYQPKGAK